MKKINKDLDAILNKIDEVLGNKPTKVKKPKTPEKFAWYKEKIEYINDHSKNLPERKKKYIKQLETRGFADDETWSLDHCFAKWMLPRLKRFKEVNNGFPHGHTEKSWDEVLDQIIETFEFMASDKYYSSYDKKEWAKVHKGLDLFREHLMDLWW